MRRILICGNWKLHQSIEQTRSFIRECKSKISQMGNIDIALAPVAPLLSCAVSEADGSAIQIAAQNVFYEAKGAFTGEWAVSHLVELGCKLCIVGHSERRQYFAESNEAVAKKALVCFQGGITPIVCIGETLEQRQSNQVEQVLRQQLEPVLLRLTQDQINNLVIAYEPIWAIGTGVVASNEDIAKTHTWIRGLVSERTRILYGGSAKPESASEILKQPNVDGLLVGGASLEVQSFVSILHAAR